MKANRIGLMTCLLLLLVSGGVLAQSPDVPPGHWAYDAVQSLVDRGYLDLADDGMFHGEETVSRYELAGAVASLLDDIEEGRVQIGASADVEMLRRLESEFRAELVAWYDARNELEEAHGQTQRQVAVIGEQLNNILLELELIDSEMHALDTELAALEAAAGQREQRLDAHDANIVALDEDVIALYDQLASLGDQLTAANDRLRTEIDELYKSVVDALDVHGVSVDEQFYEQMSAVGQLERELQQLRDTVEQELVPYVDDIVERFDNRLGEQGAALFLRIEELDATFAEQLARQADEFGEELDSVRRATQSETKRLDEAVTSLRDELDTVRAAATEHEREWQATFEEQRAALELLSTMLDELEERAASDTVDLGDRLDNDVAELRAIMSMLDERWSELQRDVRTVERHTATLTDAVMDMSALAENLRVDMDALSARLDDDQSRLRAELAAVQDELGALQGVLGTSEEQIALLTERVRRDLDEQLALTLHREGRLERQLSELQDEFASYREKSEQELQSARSMSTIGIGAAILAVVLGLAN